MRKSSLQDTYIKQTFRFEDSILISIEDQLIKDQKHGIQISASDALILQFLIRTFNIKRILELGTLYGYSTLCMARALPLNGKVITLDLNLDHTQMAQTLLSQDENSKKIEFLTGDARAVLKELEGPFDMVFIDANKSAYLDYLDWAMLNTTSGSLIIGDNTFLFGGVYGQGSNSKSNSNQIKIMQEFNRRLADPDLFDSCLIPTAEGLMVARRK